MAQPEILSLHFDTDSDTDNEKEVLDDHADMADNTTTSGYKKRRHPDSASSSSVGPSSSRAAPQSTRWCFTINNPKDFMLTPEDVMSWNCRYLCFQKEVGEEGTEHYQGPLSFFVGLFS